MMTTSCPICQRAMDGRTRAEWPRWPFCSARCKTIDLGRWLSGTYRVPAEDQEGAPSEEEEEVP
jgi:endogenous inhibitor of DNA gyrase (YacG/DUF329 family)